MSAWKTRIELAQRGWHTNIRISREGIGKAHPDKRSIGIWAETGYWKGSLANVCLHLHTICDIRTDGKAALEALVADVNEVCLRAESEFTDRVPCMGIGRDDEGRGILLEHSDETERLRGMKKEHWPTEKLLPDAASYVDGGICHLDALHTAALMDISVEDSLNTYLGPPRYAHDCKDREWGYRLRLIKSLWGGEKLSFQPQTSSTHTLHEVYVGRLIEGSSEALNELFELYGSHGACAGQTPNGLPPGFMTLRESLDAREAENAARLDALGIKADEDDLEP